MEQLDFSEEVVQAGQIFRDPVRNCSTGTWAFKKKLCDKILRNCIKTKPKCNILAQKDKKRVIIYILSNVILCLLNAAFVNSYALWSLLFEKKAVKKFVSTLIPKTGTTVPSSLLLSYHETSRMFVRQA